MFLQESPPDTSRYMVLGYSIAFVVMTIYVFSLYIRNRNLNRDKAILEEMDKSASTPEPSKESKSSGG